MGIKKIITLGLVSITVASTGIVSFANEETSTSLYGINAPAKYEYKSVTETLTPSEASLVRNDVNYVKKQNTVSSYVKLSGTAMKAAGLKISGTITNTVGKMIKSDMNIRATESVAKSVIDSKKSAKVSFKCKRFFDGMKMHPWYYYSITKL